MTGALEMIGHAAAETAFQSAKASGHLHHAWILKGPSGIGKSLLVRRLCASLLGASNLDQEGDAVVQKVISGSHPDLKWVTRTTNDKGQLKQDISVEQIRDLNHFFTLRPALSGWRIGVIDALDEMNVSGLNALLKTLEEPPNKAILFLISHGTKPDLPTIRSRCQLLRLNPLSNDDTKAVLDRKGGADSLVLPLANGRPGLALSLGAEGIARTIQATRDLLSKHGTRGDRAVAEALSKAVKSDEALAVYTTLIMDWCATKAEDNPAYASTWLKLQHLRAQADDLNLTPLQRATKLWAVLNSQPRAANS